MTIIKRCSAYYPSQRIRTCKELYCNIGLLLRFTLKKQWIELQFVQQDADAILDNKTIPNVYIPRDIHHRFAYGEEVERFANSQMWSPYCQDVERAATTAAPFFFDIDNDGCSEYEVDLDDL